MPKRILAENPAVGSAAPETQRTLAAPLPRSPELPFVLNQFSFAGRDNLTPLAPRLPAIESRCGQIGLRQQPVCPLSNLRKVVNVVQRSDHGPERFDEKRQFAHPIRSSFCAAAFFLFLPQQPPPPFDMPARDVNCGFIVLSAILLTMLACFALIRRKP
jgi:hypothetical protein